mmetsp:Transcript_62704/g.130337  ORF Transcript_62704/g.130337 Transcript_62704/m.130337 type:complete len:143 (-) Transcript_62704:2618-3046(-)
MAALSDIVQGPPENPAAEIMAKNVLQTFISEEMEEVRASQTSRKRKQVEREVVATKSELRDSANRAATEYWMDLDSADRLTFQELSAKHGCSNATAVHHAVKAMSSQEEEFKLARQFAAVAEKAIFEAEKKRQLSQTTETLN